MKVTFLTNRSNNYNINNVNPCRKLNRDIKFSYLSVNSADTVSFGRTAQNAEKMRELFKYGMIDIHSGKPVIDPEWFKQALQKDLFNRPISTIVKAIKPYEECLQKVESEIFKEIKKYANTNPSYKLDDVIQKLAPKAQLDLLTKQRPIFQQLKNISVQLPAEQKLAFDELMLKTENQLENKPITYKFSKKEFKYKLERIQDDIKRRGVQEEVKAINTLITMSSKLPYIPSGRNFLRRVTKFNPKRMLSQANIIIKMDSYMQRSVLKEDKELNDLFSMTKKQLFNIPIVIPFKRKSFIHELQAITDTLDDTGLARKMSKIACQLPTAQEEVSAFIMKSSRYSSVKIGHDLLFGSVGAIDHLEPFSHGGADAIENYAFTSNAMNSKRGNKPIAKWIKENPQTKIGSQKCIDRLFELEKQGILSKEDFSIWYAVSFAKRMRKLSKGELDLALNFASLN